MVTENRSGDYYLFRSMIQKIIYQKRKRNFQKKNNPPPNVFSVGKLFDNNVMVFHRKVITSRKDWFGNRRMGFNKLS